MLSYVSAWSLADMEAVRQALNTLPVDIRNKLEDLALAIIDPDDQKQVKSSADFLYILVRTE